MEFSDDVEYQLAALNIIMTDAQMEKVEIANDHGVSPELFVSFYEERAEHDTDGNGSYTQSEIKEMIDEMKGLSRSQRAVLWQIGTSAKSAKNNPYSSSVGQKVLDAKEKRE